MPTGVYIRKVGITTGCDRFWAQVQKTDGCWLWTGWVINSHIRNYGHIRFQGKMQSAHRVSWIIAKGEIPNGMCVLHHCDNPRCVNPAHLFLGTCHDNHLDMVRKHRSTAKLTDSQVLEIHKSSLTLSKLAKLYNISISQIWRIKSGILWKHLVGGK